MNKKLLIFLSILITLVVLFPIVGSKLAEQTLNKQIEILKLNGLEIKNQNSDFKYFSTQLHYEFLIKDAQKFIQYINQKSNQKIPTAYDDILEGTLVGIDIEHSNFMTDKDIEVDIYPLALAKQLSKNREFNDFLQNRGLLYHINYNLLTQDFSAYVKDIDEEFILEDKTKISLVVLKSRHSGNGNILKANSFISNSEKISLKSSEDSKNINFLITNLALNYKTNNETKKIEFQMKTSFDNLLIASDEGFFNIVGFNYDIFVKDIDKDAMAELEVYLSTIKTKYDLYSQQDAIEKSVMNLITRGLTLSIEDLSFKNIVINRSESLDSFSFKSKLILEKDSKFKTKNITTNIELELSKKIFSQITAISPMVNLAKFYAKDKGDSFYFSIELKDDNLKVNNKKLSF